MSAAALSAAALSAAALSAASESSVEVDVESPKTEPMISTSSVPAGNSMLKVLLWVFVSVSVKLASSPSAKIIKSSSAPLKIESKKDLSNVISSVPVYDSN